MTLETSSRLGPFEILELRGKGGMGEVYRARDTRLDRTVAIKVIPQESHHDRGSRERLRREAKAISQLQHPHVCTLFELGSHEDLQFLVMEYLEGATLSERLRRGRIPIPQLLEIGAQLAGAVRAAHRLGLVHRDLKPSNVMLTESGVKVLDFGLARHAASTISGAGTDPSTAVTMATPLTDEGHIVGTLPYMAPEQVVGESAETTCDIWALGCVLYEMVTGKPAFSGTSPRELVSAILNEQPAPATESVADLSPALEHVIERCLAKDPEERWQSAGDVQRELLWVAETSADSSTDSPRPAGVTARWRAPVFIAGAVLGVLASVATYWALARPDESTSASHAIRFSISPPSGGRFGNVPSRPAPAISPDGQKIAYVASTGDEHSLWVRELSSAAATSLNLNVNFPFWSPEGRRVGGFGQGRLKKVSIDNPTAQSLADARGFGGAWSEEGVILFSQTDGLFKVSEAGGEPEQVTWLDRSKQERIHAYPAFLPDGRHFVFTIVSSTEDRRGIWLGSIDGMEPRRILGDDSNAVFAPPDILLFVREGTLLAQRIDTETFMLVGGATPLARGVTQGMTVRYAPFAASETALVYRTDVYDTARLVWFDRSGTELEEIGEPAPWGSASLSPDGHRVATSLFETSTGNWDLYILELDRRSRRRFTQPASGEWSPIWSPDGKDLAFLSTPNQVPQIYRTSASGVSEMQPVPAATGYKEATDWRGDTLLYSLGGDIWISRLDSGEQHRLVEDHAANWGRLSPDGRLLTYASTEEGTWHVYVQTYPDLSADRWRVSNDPGQTEPGGGIEPRFSRDGRELYYLANDPERTLMVLDLDGVPDPDHRPEVLFETGARIGGQGWNFDVSADGERFLVKQQVVDRQQSMTVVLNWATMLEDL